LAKIKEVKSLITLILNLSVILLRAQTEIGGTVTDRRGETLAGVNVFIKGSFEGASTDENGKFSFNTSLQGKQTIIASYVGFQTIELETELAGIPLNLDFSMKESTSELDAVVITAGSFEASDEKKSVMLKPLDIVTTAGGLADIPSAINTLPGTQFVGEEGKLFVRGGDGYETRTFIDGMIVDKPYESTLPDVPSRGRFSPFLFKGTIFSSGGYSAEFGQALSSALILQSTDLPDESVTGISLMSVGLGVSHTQKWKKNSFGISADYFNLSPYFAMISQDFDWQEPPNGFGGSFSFRQKTDKDGMVKAYGQISDSYSKMRYPSFSDVNEFIDIAMDDRNTYFNATYTDIHGDKLISNAGISYTSDLTNGNISGNRLNEKLNALQLRYNLTYQWSESLQLKSGGDFWNRNFSQSYFGSDHHDELNSSFNDQISSVFAEAEYRISKRFAIRGGARSEYSALMNQVNLAPRLSMAYKTGDKSQVSFAYGIFFQSPNDHYLMFNSGLRFEQASHYLLNYQFVKNNRVFRIEFYYKDYQHLVKYDSLYLAKADIYTNDGNGYAKGVDIFWRDNSMGNHDYWISYSFLDSKRNYKDYPVNAVPEFVSNHNLSVVYKYFISKISSQIGFTYKLGSGRTYYNPSNPVFLGDKTKPYQDLSFNISYLTELWDKFTIVYFSLGNVLGFDNNFGYRYSLYPDSQGNYSSVPVKPGAKRFVFLGVFIPI
jgi:hypothetical protein